MPVMRNGTFWVCPSLLSSSTTYTMTVSIQDCTRYGPMLGECLLSRATTLGQDPADSWCMGRHLLVGVEPAACVVLLQGLKSLVLQYANHPFQAVHDPCKQHLPGTATWSAELAPGRHAFGASMPVRAALHSLPVHQRPTNSILACSVVRAESARAHLLVDGLCIGALLP